MCFSMEASFSASAILAVAGGLCLKEVKSKKMLPLGLVPLLTSLQQSIEGFIWREFHLGQSPGMMLTYMYLFFAFLLWPILVPFCFYLFEEMEIRKKLLKLLSIYGWVISLSLFMLTAIYGFKASIAHRHVHYNFLILPSFQTQFIFLMESIFAALYCSAIIFPPLISSLKKTNFLGFAFFWAVILSAYISWVNMISIWCFFCALSSGLILWILKEYNKSHQV